MHKAVLLALALVAFAPPIHADASPDAGSLKQDLAELEKTRQEFEKLSEQLDVERARLERETREAAARRDLMFTAGGVGVMVFVVGFVAWLVRRHTVSAKETRRSRGPSRDRDT